MRISRSILIVICVITFARDSFSQPSSKVYIGQTAEKIYYSVYVNSVVLETMDTTSAKEYMQNGDYSIGDLVKIPVQIGSEKNARTVYAQIIDQVSPEFLTGINNRVLAEAQSKFGEDKVAVWPEEYLKRNPWGIKYDEKTLECEYYIINTLKGFTPRIDIAELGDGTSIPSSDGLICFSITNGTDNNSFKVEQLSNFTGSSFSLVLKNKLKAGKKGKNIAKNSHNDLTKEEKTVTKILFKDIKTEADNRVESILEAWKMFFSPEIKDEMVSTSDKFLRENMNSTVEEFFKEVDENL